MTVESQRSTKDNRTSDERYTSLLSTFPRTRVGWGREPNFPGYASQPMTYALVALAEARAAPRIAPTYADRLCTWLLDHADLDKDGLVGWGLPYEWDAFGDGVGAAGATNPRHHPYTITTALAIQALSASVKAGRVGEELRQRLVRVTTAACLRWAREAVTFDSEGAWFWYSPHESDAVFVPNVSAMLAGAMREAVSTGMVVGPDARFVESVTDAAVERLVASVASDAPQFPAWMYISGAPTPRTNDAVHHAYSLWGLETYRDEGGKVSLPWSKWAAAASCEAFFRARVFTETPRTGPDVPPVPARLWGAGMCLAVVARFGSVGLAEEMAVVIEDAYSGPEGLRVTPAPAAGVFPRHVAHVVLGLAELTRQGGN